MARVSRCGVLSVPPCAHTEELCESWPVWPLTKGGGDLLPAQVTFRDSASVNQSQQDNSLYFSHLCSIN